MNENGKEEDDWYALPVQERERKVAAMLIPNLFAYLQSVQDRVNSELEALRSKGKH